MSPSNILPEIDPRDIEEAIRQLTAEDHLLRRAAARALGESGDPCAVEPLIARLKFEKNGDARMEAALALGKLGDSRAVEPLIDGLTDRYWRVRMAAAESLGKLGDVSAIGPLIGRLFDMNSGVRCAVALALGEIGDLKAVESLILQLDDEIHGVRASAAEALGKLGDKRAVVPLITRLADEFWRVRMVAAEALGKLGNTIAVRPLILRLEDEEEREDVRRAAAEALRKLGDPHAIDEMPMSNGRELSNAVFDFVAREPLVRSIQQVMAKFEKDNNKLDRERCQEEIKAYLGDRISYADLMWAINNRSKDLELRRLVAKLLWPFDKSDVVNALLRVLDEDDLELRRNAVQSLGLLTSKAVRAVDRLIDLVKNADDPELRRVSAVSLGLIGTTPAMDTLISLLYENDAEARRYAVEGLGMSRKPQIVDSLIPRLSDEDAGVRVGAAKALGGITDQRSIEPLCSLLADGHVEAKLAAAIALSKIGDVRAVPALTRALLDESPHLRSEAANALMRIAYRHGFLVNANILNLVHFTADLVWVGVALVELADAHLRHEQPRQALECYELALENGAGFSDDVRDYLREKIDQLKREEAQNPAQ